MNKLISTKIKDIKFVENKIILETDKGEYYSDIIKGSISFEIRSTENKILPLSYLENGDLIQIKSSGNKIIKIFVNLKYDFISESSEEDYLN